MRTIAPVSFVLVLSGFATSAAGAQQRPPAADTAVVSRNLRTEQREDPKFAPDRHEGTGPFAKLIIRGATLIDGTGGPPRGPVDIDRKSVV